MPSRKLVYAERRERAREVVIEPLCADAATLAIGNGILPDHVAAGRAERECWPRLVPCQRTRQRILAGQGSDRSLRPDRHAPVQDWEEGKQSRNDAENWRHTLSFRINKPTSDCPSFPRQKSYGFLPRVNRGNPLHAGF